MREVMCILLCGIAFVLSGCQGAAIEPPQIETSRVFNGSFDDTWSAIVQAFADRNYPIKTIEKDSGVIASEPLSIPIAKKEFNKFGILPSKAYFYIWETARCNLTLYARALGNDQTSVRVNSTISAYESNMTKQWHTCYSTGMIEKIMLDKIADKLSIQLLASNGSGSTPNQVSEPMETIHVGGREDVTPFIE